MTKEEIIMALTCCAEGKTEWCDKCPLKVYEGNCCAELAKEALTELKSKVLRLQELYTEIERLKALCELKEQDHRDTCEDLFKAEDEIVRLKKKQKVIDVQSRSKVIYEMAQRLKDKRECRDGLYFNVVSFDTIDEIALEMIGEEK